MDLLLDNEIWGLNKDARLTNGIGYFGNDKRYEFNNKAYNVWYHILRQIKNDPENNSIC